MKRKVTTLQMEIALMQFFGITKNIIVPNITHMSGLVGFESDLLVLSKSGYATCVEIKVSKGDLRNDLKKDHIKNLGCNWRSYNGNNGKNFYYKNLKYFIYAVPDYLGEEALKQIPDFCGLLVGKTYEHEGRTLISFFNNKGKGASKIFNTKWTVDMQLKLATLGTMRILKYKRKLI